MVPDGTICFFTSYQYIESVVVKWDEMGVLRRILEQVRVERGQCNDSIGAILSPHPRAEAPLRRDEGRRRDHARARQLQARVRRRPRRCVPLDRAWQGGRGRRLRPALRPRRRDLWRALPVHAGEGGWSQCNHSTGGSLMLQYTQSHVLRQRLEFMRRKYHIREADFLTFDAIRQVLRVEPV